MLRRLALFILCCSLLSFAQTKHPFTFDDMMKLKRIGEPIVSPDGKWVAFSAVDVDLEKNTKTPHLWIVPLTNGAVPTAGAEPGHKIYSLTAPQSRRLTPATGAGEDRIRFAPDGKRVLFESPKDGSSQIYVQDFDTSSGTLTGEPRKVTSLSTEASGGTWSPDGHLILFVSSVWPDCT